MKLIECPATGELVCRPGEECITVMTFGGCYVEDALLEELMEIDEGNAELQHELRAMLSSTVVDGYGGNADLGSAPPSGTTGSSMAREIEPQQSSPSSSSAAMPLPLVPRKRPRSPLARGSVSALLSRGRSPARKH